jgi:uncharacterized protein YraI
MKKTVFLIFCLSFGCQVLLAQKMMYVNSSNGINLREGPGTSYKTITNIPNGSKLDVVGTDDEWLRVSYEGKTGYVSKQYLTEDKPQNQNSSKKNSSSSSSNSRATNRKNNSGSSNPDRSSSSYQNDYNWGIGVRLGDPSGLTAKKYLTGGKALEFSIGNSSHYRFDYRDDFYDRDRYDGYDFLDYDRRGSVTIQAHYLFQKDFPNATGLQWYWGFGPQIRLKTYEYYYRFRDYYGPGSDEYIWVYDRDKVTNVDFGADIVLGLEYHIPNAPLSVFGDANILLELFDDPLSFYGQGGVGIRYNFK